MFGTFKCVTVEHGACEPDWQHYFPEVDAHAVTSLGVTVRSVNHVTVSTFELRKAIF